MDIKIIFLAFLVCGTLYLLARAEPVEDKRALLDFIDNINHVRKLNWDERTSVCYNWTGITCNHDNSGVIAVRLPSSGFQGSIPLNTLGRLSGLQILNLKSNGISGTFPSDLLKLGNLMSLYLQFNNLQGPLPSDFSVWKNLSVLDLSSNAFNGSVPLSLLNLTHLEVLNLSDNSLSGDIPDLNIPTLQVLDLSYNNLSGAVPQSLKRFPRSAFLGNNISPENSTSPAPPPRIPPKKHKSKLSESGILGIILGSCALGFVLIALLLVVSHRKKRKDKSTTEASPKKEKVVSEHQGNGGRLTFFEGCNLAFDLEDLLRASAEVLGKGTFGTTYKAALEDATTVAVKRLKEVIVGKKDFEQHMAIVGNIRHENVAPLRAYYYSKDEKLVVYDYYNQGSVSALLHAKRGENWTPLDWETRLKVAMGAARGMAHIHSQTGGKLAHGNIKASNIFINSQQYGCVCDVGLATLMNPITPPAIRATGYRAPEITDTRKATQASDVYSFGVFILELLTGKSPVYSSGGEEIIHLVRWVHSVVREEWTGEVFDVELLRYPNIEEEMVSMLQIGMSCVERMPEQRPKIEDVVKMLEEIRGVNTGNTPSGGTRSPGSTPSRLPEIGTSS
ncbi:putative inactive receptor kinase-like [Dorcoceras hygrometricum]|uniref:Putative inactive receptor kinase-like n=1 Tax=Dorcoceras hygrometricum TaxID=472368 RepID=A0A2Z7BNF6_9LAMI|nr:putative inactive receptor kinase-like [Dorcoceras hygrometricum]